MAGIFHGACRVWHRNGQLAEELRYRDGLMHGMSREWDENGRLLGSFTMVNGSGLQRYWHDNGQIKLEISSLASKFHGRCRDWLRDGTLIREDYYINYQDVTRAAYLKAARKNPNWPQYEGEPAGRVARPSLALERKKHDLFIQSVLEKPHHAEARAWLKAELRPKSRSLAKFATTKAALKFVEQLYSAGAVAVIIAAISAGQRKKLFADWLLIQLPPAKSMDRNMEDELTLTALRMALSRRSIRPGLVHHSDRGSQYASKDYTDLLKANQIDISMSRKGNPWDNAACESFMKTLKYEEVLRNEYRDLAEAFASIPEFLEKVYNQKRLHSALGYLPPVEFEAQLAAQNMEAAARQLIA